MENLKRMLCFKAGCRGFESHMSTLSYMKLKKRALRLVALFAFKSLHSHAGQVRPPLYMYIALIQPNHWAA